MKNNKLNFLFLSIFLLLFISIKNPPIVKGEGETFSKENIESGEFSFYEKGVLIQGTKPVCIGVENNLLNERVNAIINQRFKKRIEEMNGYEDRIDFSYSIYENEQYLSIVLVSSTSNRKEDRNIDTFVIDLVGKKLVDINDILGKQGEKLIGFYIEKERKKNPAHYYIAPLPTISIENFYVKGEELVIYLDGKDISPSKKGQVEFILPLDELMTFTITKEEYNQENPYHVRMIDIFSLLEGFQIEYEEREDEILIKTKDKIEISIFPNDYIIKINGKEQVLEMAAFYKEDKLLVPISFVYGLDMVYTVYEDGKIVFAKWQ